MSTFVHGSEPVVASRECGKELRTSSYVIYVDLPGTPDEWLLVHGYTGAYDRVSRRVASYVRSREVANVPKPLYGEWASDELIVDGAWTPPDETIALLRRRGYLTDRSRDEELELFKKYVGMLHEAQVRTMPHYVIMPTYDCNLRCHYCFQDHMRTNPAYNGLLKPMSVENADRIMASFDYIEESLHGVRREDVRKRKFTFFGGEPLLARSRGVVEHIISSQRALGPCEFGAVTNATELDAFEGLLGANGLAWLQITIDGTPDKHDRRRVYADGSGSFARIAQNLTMALDRAVRVTVRVNVDRSNFEDLESLAETFQQLGWPKYSRFSAYLAPVHDYSPEGLGNGSSRGDFFNSWELGEMLKELHGRHEPSRVFIEVDGGMKSRARNLFEHRTAEAMRPQYCGAHSSMYLFDPFGDIYACWDRTGDDKMRIGRVDEDGKVTLNGIGDMWRSRTVASNPTCSQCRFALNCGGGCAVLAEGSSGTIFSNFCDAFGKRFRAAVADAYMDHAAGKARKDEEAQRTKELLL